ncbi:MAG: YjjG family noncanonical pyrimidine nucleotidase [Oscillospiraceae bacterium]|nr:YjjG family noncanonical pyrimidine nucleotidase [Oscillospiraceae bacterium]
MRARYDWVLLDADRTLFDFDRSEQMSIRQTLRHYGIADDQETVERYLQVNHQVWAQFDRGELAQDRLGRERFARFLRLMEVEGPDPEEMNLYYLNGLARYPYLLEGAEELCRRLAPHCRLAIVTNGLTAAQTGRLAASRLRDVIGHLFISQQLGLQKPDPAYFSKVFQTLGIRQQDKARTVIVGDSLSSDIQGGINAGIDTIWFNPQGKKSPDGVKISCIAPTLEAVGEFILNI